MFRAIGVVEDYDGAFERFEGNKELSRYLGPFGDPRPSMSEEVRWRCARKW